MYKVTVLTTSFLQGQRADVEKTILEFSVQELEVGCQEVQRIVRQVADEVSGIGITRNRDELDADVKQGFSSLSKHTKRHDFLVCLHGGITDGTFCDIVIESK